MQVVTETDYIINVRGAKNLIGNPITTIQNGSVVDLIGEDANWYTLDIGYVSKLAVVKFTRIQTGNIVFGDIPLPEAGLTPEIAAYQAQLNYWLGDLFDNWLKDKA